LSQPVKDFSVLFAEIADAYFEKQLWAEAKPIYELLGGDPEVSTFSIIQHPYLIRSIRRVACIYCFKQQYVEG
jgi:hypothetical protein